MAIWDDRIEETLLHLHTAFLAKIVSTDGKTAKIQPLTLIKQYGRNPIKQAPVEDVPILQSVKKYQETEWDCACGMAGGTLKTEKRKHWGTVELEAGDLVYCLCCERDITEARRGKEALPAVGHHQIQDAIIIGVL